MPADKRQDESLLLLFQKTRKTSLSVLGDVSEAQARWLPQGEVNHILWHLSSFDDAYLSSPITWSDPRWYGRPKRVAILHGFYDELLHMGQVMQLKRMYNASQAIKGSSRPNTMNV